MSDKFYRISIKRLLKWILEEEKQDRIFGIHKDLFYRPNRDDVFRITRYSQVLETPIGVAAGPHTQLAQNIIAAWLTGARYIELKTVQTLDELDVTKPCIDMEDEGYNCEWSQELRLTNSFDEYLNAWILIHILKDKFGWGNQEQPGVIFNMSVGYNMEGILQPNVQRFLDKMGNCREELELKINALSGLYPGIKDLAVPSRMSDNITLSTMHGCPPEEIEKIGCYLIEKRKLHTTIKLNPTLLGAGRLRYILNDKLGYDIRVPDEAFEHDLKYKDAVALIHSLQTSAQEQGVQFSLKLTNTLEVENTKQVFPENEKMMYMSGRALHPISINLAEKLQNEFNGRLDISFCAGVDCFNVSDVLACGLAPVTVCTDILKPGGYTRLGQYLEEIDHNIRISGSWNIEDYILAKANEKTDVNLAGLENLRKYSQRVVEDEVYHKIRFPYENIKTTRPLTAFDCIYAPCVETCATTQDVPKYMFYTAKGDYRKALEVILKTNPFPNVTGAVCDHLCVMKCTRINYDNPLLIREIKGFIAGSRDHDFVLKPAPQNDVKVVIIGAGPTGLACAYFLALDGFEVHVFESKSFPGGMVADAIPNFRLSNESIQKDIDSILQLGVNIHFNAKVNKIRFEKFSTEYDYIYIAAGAQRSKKLGIPGEEASGVMDQLIFLSATRKGKPFELGQRVAVIGGGNSAMDAARTAQRLIGENGQVTVVYRRTRKEMPANVDEVQELLEEGIQLIELTAPVAIITENGCVKSLVCTKMKLGDKDASGRPRPVKVADSEFELPCSTIITAIGQDVILNFMKDERLTVDPVTNETQFKNIFAGGDAVRGASSIINAIGDGKNVAENIAKRALKDLRIPIVELDKELSPSWYQKKQAIRRYRDVKTHTNRDSLNFNLFNLSLDEQAARKEAERCLYCDDFCNICVSVCPNRALVSFAVEPTEIRIQEVGRTESGVQVNDLEMYKIDQKYQILTIGDFCNECGNCTTFCPTEGAPYKQKPKFYLTEESWNREDSGYFLQGSYLKVKKNGNVETLTVNGGFMYYETDFIVVKINSVDFRVLESKFKSNNINRINLQHAIEMNVLWKGLNDFYLFRQTF